MRRSTLLLAALCCAVATGCGDQSLTGPGRSGKSTLATTVSLDAEINAIIDASFPTGLRTAAHTRWDNVKRQLDKNKKGPSQAAKQQYLNLVDWIRQQQGKLRPPNGETPEHAAARLVLDMSLFVYNGPDYQPPVVVTPTADVALAVVTPSTTEPTDVVTPTEKAAVSFPPGSVAEPTVVVIAQSTQNYPDNCTGPLDTRYCQYPQFYEFNVFPDVHLAVPARVEVCHINAGTARRPLPGADHDEFRIAHDKPADPANYTEGATQIDGIEILPFVSTGALAQCGDNSYSFNALGGSGGGLFGRALASLATHVMRALTPKNAYAIDQGGGGEVSFFSHFAIVDPHSKPDFAPAPSFTLSAASVVRGTPITINDWTVQNIGTAASRYSVVPVIATDSLLTTDAQNLATPVASPNALSPHQSGAPQPTQTVTIPETLSRGTYFVGVRIIPDGPLPDLNLDNNVVSVRVSVSDPYTYVCPGEGDDPYTVLTAGVAATGEGGTMVICDGSFRVDTAVQVNKGMTIRPEHTNGTTLADNWAGGFAQQAQTVFMVRHATGPVRVVGLTFSIRGRGVVGDTDFVRIDVDSSRFISRDTVGIGVMTNRVPGVGVVDVTHSHFEKLTIGFFAVGDNEASMHRSISTDMYGSTMTYSNSTAHGVVEDNQISCGAAGCIRIINAGNTIARRNTLDGRDKMVPGQAAIAVIPNALEAHTPITVEDNTILSARVPAADSTTAGGWTVTTAVLVQDNTPTVHVIQRNAITAAFRAFQVNGSANIHDNTVTQGLYAFGQGPIVPMTITRNDFVSLGRSFTAPSNSTGDFRCNWWDSANGPANPPVTSASYWPWAMQPVAGSSSACDPNVDRTTVRACPDQPLGGNPWNLGSVAAAYGGVEAGGTVNICDGTHVVQNLIINKAVTLQAAGPGMPILDGGGAPNVLNRAGGNFASTVRGLRFRNASQHLVLVGNNSGTFLAENNVFEPRESFAYNPDLGTYQQAYWSGLGVFQAVGTVTIRNNTFTGGDIGIHINTSPATGTANVTVLNNQFTGQTNAGLFTGATSAGYFLHAEGNTFDQCGRTGCTKAYGTEGRAEYVNNVMHVTASRHVFNPINIMLPSGTALVSNNQILGSGGSGDRFQQQSYAIDGWAIQVRGSAQVSGNHVTDAWSPFYAAGTTLSGSDNVFTRMAWVGYGDAAQTNVVALNRSDITDFTQMLPGGSAFASFNLQCNWWGNAGGPTNTGGTPAPVYTPWATQPIAGKPAVICP